MARRIVQIATAAAYDSQPDGGQYHEVVFALCGDGSLWRLNQPFQQHPTKAPEWVKMPDVPGPG